MEPCCASRHVSAVSRLRSASPRTAACHAAPAPRTAACHAAPAPRAAACRTALSAAARRIRRLRACAARRVCASRADGEADVPSADKRLSFASIKRFGVAGTVSYVLTELVFWALALPGAAFTYHATTGEWLSWDTDRAQLAAMAATFVTGVRFAVPLRMGVALACVPAVQRALDAAGVTRGDDSEQPRR